MSKTIEKGSEKVPGKGRRRKRRKRTSTKPTINERILPDFSFDDALTSVETPDEQSGKVLSAAKNSKPDDPLPDGSDCCKADAQPKGGEQDESLETSQREEHPPMLPSKLSEHKEKDTTVSTDTSKHLNQPSWTTDDDDALLLARRRHPDLTWAEIAALLPGNRSLSACYSRYHKVLLKKCAASSKRPRGRPRKTPQRDSETRIVGRSSSNASWTTKENNILKRNKAKGLSWEEVARLLPERSWRECKQQYEKLRTTMKADSCIITNV